MINIKADKLVFFENCAVLAEIHSAKHVIPKTLEKCGDPGKIRNGVKSRLNQDTTKLTSPNFFSTLRVPIEGLDTGFF